jgi:hypothetical protein
MGLILDSNLLIAAERRGQNARQMLPHPVETGWKYRDRPLGRHSDRTWRTAQLAPTPRSEGKMRQQFVQELIAALPIHPVTVSVALRAGQIDGANQAQRIRLPLSDLLIGVTALDLGYGVATGNLRHFQLIPGLSVEQF